MLTDAHDKALTELYGLELRICKDDLLAGEFIDGKYQVLETEN